MLHDGNLHRRRLLPGRHRTPGAARRPNRCRSVLRGLLLELHRRHRVHRRRSTRDRRGGTHPAGTTRRRLRHPGRTAAIIDPSLAGAVASNPTEFVEIVRARHRLVYGRSPHQAARQVQGPDEPCQALMARNKIAFAAALLLAAPVAAEQQSVPPAVELPATVMAWLIGELEAQRRLEGPGPRRGALRSLRRSGGSAQPDRRPGGGRGAARPALPPPGLDAAQRRSRAFLAHDAILMS